MPHILSIDHCSDNFADRFSLAVGEQRRLRGGSPGGRFGDSKPARHICPERVHKRNDRLRARLAIRSPDGSRDRGRMETACLCEARHARSVIAIARVDIPALDQPIRPRLRRIATHVYDHP